jgi:alginate O-acetyltransferase complex protein AlgI
VNFISLPFLAFFLVVVCLFYTLPARLRLPMLLAASYLFYATWSIPFIAVILITTSFDYWMSHIIHASKSQQQRKVALTLGLLMNIAILAFFKYTNFLLETTHGLFNGLGIQLNLPHALQILLPLGISFYTFEAISYMVDVYRGKEPAPNWLQYNFYIMYFPHLISGPIVRFAELFPQYQQPLERPSMQRMAKGFELLLLGFLFKVLLADTVAPLADKVFLVPSEFSTLSAYIAALAFTVQIYFDFMGYTHIARGASLLFNIEMPLNFNHPYVATNISNFWERWHISLSSWIRDYLYFPLGGSRGTLFATVCNLMITMLICGAWHGAGWTFIIWGAYHGFLLSIYHVFKHIKKKSLPKLASLSDNFFYRMGAICTTYFLVVIGWVLFRAPNIDIAHQMLSKMANFKDLSAEVFGLILTRHFTQINLVLFLALACFSGPWIIRITAVQYRSLPYWAKVQLACVLLFLCWIMTAEGTHPFIYFQF